MNVLKRFLPAAFCAATLALSAADRPAVNRAVGENKATPVSRIKAAPGFQVELLYSVPGNTQGSWVSLCSDAKGRIIASDQYGGLYRFAPPAPGQQQGGAGGGQNRRSGG